MTPEAPDPQERTERSDIKDAGELELTDDGLEMPDWLKGYTGSFTLKTASITGTLMTTDHGLPESEYFDGVIAVYPEDGDYNPELAAGEMILTAPGYPERRYTIIDRRTDESEEVAEA